MFAASDRGTDIVRSVTLLYARTDESPLRHDVAPLGEPRRTDASTPHSAFIGQWYRKEHPYGTYSASTVAELFTFENAKSARKIEVYVWAIGHGDSLHYAYLLQIVDM